MPAPEPRPLRLALVSPPFAGHLNPLLALGRDLSQRGHEVFFVTGPRKAALVEACGFAVETVSKADPGAMERIADTPRPVRGNPFRLARQLRANLDLLPQIHREVEEAFDRRRPDVVVADFCAPVAGWAAEARQIPWITVLRSAFALETQHGTPSYLGGWGPARHFGHRLRDALGRAATRATKKAMEVAFAGHFRRLSARVYRADGSEAAYSPTAILGLGMTELEFERDWPAAFTMIGPVTGSPEPEPLPLDLPDVDPARLVLITLGTHLGWAKQGLTERVERLARAFPRHHFAISLGDLAKASAAPSSRGGNWSVYPYVSYERHLGHFAAVVHHGGAGITYGCIQAARPSLVWPCDYDQFDFAARIAHRGVGIRIRDLGTKASAKALDRLLHDFDRRPLEAMAAAATRYDACAACDAVIRRLARPETPATITSSRAACESDRRGCS